MRALKYVLMAFLFIKIEYGTRHQVINDIMHRDANRRIIRTQKKTNSL